MTSTSPVCYPEQVMSTAAIAGGCVRPVIGYCHICRELEPVQFCGWCPHWLCVDCQTRAAFQGRVAAAELLNGPSLDCCGPTAEAL